MAGRWEETTAVRDNSFRKFARGERERGFLCDVLSFLMGKTSVLEGREVPVERKMPNKQRSGSRGQGGSHGGGRWAADMGQEGRTPENKVGLGLWVPHWEE